MYKIMIVEDDEMIANAVAKHLMTWNYEVVIARDFNHIMEEFTNHEPQLVLLDIILPFLNGFHWCQEIRAVSSVPIIFLSSASDNMNIVMAVNMGADDFIAKPFDLSVLTVKIQALLRRSYDFGASSSILTHNGLMLNVADANVTYENKKIELTKNELKILQILMENKNQIVSRDSIMTRLWENDSYVDENTLSVNVNRLRKKLEELGLADVILTKKGIGYRIS